MTGIYKFTNIINNKSYIGLSVNIEKRYKRHKDSYQFCDNRFYRAIRKYGWDNFKFEILLECSKNELSKMEQYFIKLYNSNNPNFGYNMTEGGEGWMGMKHTEEWKRKMSERMKLNNPMKNKKVSEKVSNALKGKTGKTASEEWKRKMSERMKLNNPMKNKEISTKTSNTKKQKNIHLSEETKNKISKALKGRKMSEETKKKMSESTKKRCRNDKGKFVKNI